MKLCEFASYIKSANAGATTLTFDIGFDNTDKYQHVVDADIISPKSVGDLYCLAPEKVKVFGYRPALVIKVTIPRPVASGGIEERDFDGVQQFAPLLNIVVPE